MKRRRSFRRFSKPVALRRTAWSPFVYDMSGVNIDTTLSEKVLFDPQSSDPASETDNNLTTRVRRILVSGGLTMQPEGSATPLFQLSALHCAVYVVDVEDTDADLLTTPGGSLLTSHRVLWRACYPFMASQVDMPSIGGIQTWRGCTVPFELDLKVGLKLQPDQLVVLGMQWGNTIAGVMDDAFFSAQGAVLFDVT